MRYLIQIFLLVTLWSCSKNDKNSKPAFKLLDPNVTGVNFTNKITPTNDLNIFQYMYFYNGAGVAAGDFNNDSLPDLFFTANQTPNKLYLNKGSLKFEDITTKADIAHKGGWSNGVSVVDINNDGLLDIYISQVDNGSFMKGQNQLWINTGVDDQKIPHFEEAAEAYGLAIKAYGTQAVFLDFDNDGDLDFFQMNHSVHENATFGKRDQFDGTYHPTAGDRYYENQDGKFFEKTKNAGINSTALGYGLGLVAGDINLDGKMDIYVGNDFHENDYLYINQGNGRFLDKNNEMLGHTSRFSMGVDLADINNDIYPEIISLDMLPFEPEMLKKSEGEDAFYNFNFKLKQGYNYQFARNALQLNNGNNTFSEIALLAGVHATDWSWSSLFADFDNDGFKDLFISNGINKRMNDTDYMNYVSNDEIQARISRKEFNESDQTLTEILPEAKMPNKFFLNKRDLTFTDLENQIENKQDSYSNGAIYIDLDQDGDLDIVSNNINDPAFIYENLSTNNSQTLSLKLIGTDKNINALGSKVIAYKNGQSHYFEKLSVRGFQSSTEQDLLIAPSPDSLIVVWPNGTYQKAMPNKADKKLILKYKEGLALFDYQNWPKNKAIEEPHDISESLGIDFTHVENDFVEFDREALIPAKMSTTGPALAVADINHDGLEDFIVGSAKKEKVAVFFQTSLGKFIKSEQKYLDADSTYEEVAFAWADFNKDGHIDLAIANGGNEYYGKTPYLKPRLFFNDGKGLLIPQTNALPAVYDTPSAIIAADFDQDGDIDIFQAGRTVSWAYGAQPRSYLFINNGKGQFTERTPEPLKYPGMVKDAHYVALHQKQKPELILAIEWGGIKSYTFNGQNCTEKLITDKKGLWNKILVSDLNGDGHLDLLAGNLGLNSRLKASEEHPLKMYVNDFDENGRLDQILTYNVRGKETLFADKKEIEKQLPFVRKNFNLSKDFAKAELTDIFGKDKIKKSQTYEANFLENCLFINDGQGNFSLQKLPLMAQISPLFAFIVKNKNVYAYGNFYDANIQRGRYDGTNGLFIQHAASKSAKVMPLDKAAINGQVRQIVEIKTNTGKAYLVGTNNQKLSLLKFDQ